MDRIASKVTLKRTADGYQADNGRFQIARKPGRSYTRGPFHTYWDIEDRQTGRGQVGLYSLDDVRTWIIAARENAK